MKTKLLERDTMPVEEAANVLLTERRLNRSQRNRLMMERAKIYVPEKQPTDEERQEARELKLIKKMKWALASQIVKWLRRVEARRFRLQRIAERNTEMRVNFTKALENAVEAGWELRAAAIRKNLEALRVADTVLSGRAELLDEAWDVLTKAARSRGIKL